MLDNTPKNIDNVEIVSASKGIAIEKAAKSNIGDIYKIIIVYSSKEPNSTLKLITFANIINLYKYLYSLFILIDKLKD